MTNKQVYTIAELADRAGVTPRTVRYYTAEGLLPPPDTRGRYAVYGDDHLHRLELIARLKEAYLPLGEIRSRLEQLSVEQVQAMLAEYRRKPAEAAPASAADYIAQVLRDQSTPPTPPPPAAAPLGYRAAGQSPTHAGFPGHGESSSPSFEARMQAWEHGRLTMPSAPLALGYAQGASATAPTRTPHAESSETWQRIPLAPGVELHVRMPAAPDVRERINLLIAQARDLFAGEE